MSESVRMKQAIEHGGPPEEREWGTWYPDSDGRRAMRDVAEELFDALFDAVSWCEHCDGQGNTKEPRWMDERGRCARCAEYHALLDKIREETP